jgi:hypothetical protein
MFLLSLTPKEIGGQHVSRKESGTQHVVPPFFFNTVSLAGSIFFFAKNTPKHEAKAVKANEFRAATASVK